MKINKLIKLQNIFFIDEDNKEKTLNCLIDYSEQLAYVSKKSEFRKSIFERENIVGTGIGCGIAIPHVKKDCINNFFILIGILKKPIDWNAIDDKPVNIILLIGGPENEQKQYLEILSVVVSFFKDEKRRKKILALKSKEEVMSLFADF